jgi:hypothetical protein
MKLSRNAKIAGRGIVLLVKQLTKEEYFPYSAAVILFFMAMVELCGAMSAARILDQPDPLLPLSNRLVLVLVGMLELLLSAYLLMGRYGWAKPGLTAWLTTNLLVYRLGLWRAGAPNFSDCVGNFNEWLPISPRVLHVIMVAALGLLIIGSYTFLILDWLGDSKSVKRNSIMAKVPRGT